MEDLFYYFIGSEFYNGELPKTKKAHIEMEKFLFQHHINGTELLSVAERENEKQGFIYGFRYAIYLITSLNMQN